MWCFGNPNDDGDEEMSLARQSMMNQTKKTQMGLEEYGLPPKWAPETNSCGNCDDNFDVFNRKHHCRACGLAFCGSCSNNFNKVYKFGFTTDVRLCTACSTTARHENEFYQLHFPRLRDGANFVKYGFLIERTVRMQLLCQSLQYQSIDLNSGGLSGDVKAISMEMITSTASVGARGLHITTTSQQHRFDAQSSEERDAWYSAIQEALNVRQYHKHVQDNANAIKIADEHRELTRVMEGLESIELKKNQMQLARLQKNQSRREALRAKYGLDDP